MNEIILLLISIFAGFIGSLLGLGGGIIIVPVLTLYFQIDIHYAIAASLVSIVASSSGAAAGFLKDHLTNLRLAVLLEVGTVTGAITGFVLVHYIQSHYLFILFGVFLLFSALMMFRRRSEVLSDVNHPWSEKLNLTAGANYKIDNVPQGLAMMYVAGALSALLGIGSGILKVIAMDGVMKLPIKVSSATSNFMIGVTAAASAGAYFLKGNVRPEITAPVAIGIIIGSWVGAKVMVKMPASLIRKIFVVVLTVVSLQMIIKGFR
ncbi:MAG: sulfite exporter TauE/SafE family protein [Pseudobdellovibrio sp.]